MRGYDLATEDTGKEALLLRLGNGKKGLDIALLQVMVVPEAKIQCGQIERDIEYVVDALAIVLLRRNVLLFQGRKAFRQSTGLRQIKDIIAITSVCYLPNLPAIFPEFGRTPHNRFIYFTDIRVKLLRKLSYSTNRLLTEVFAF